MPTITPGTPPSGGTVPVFGPPSGICASSVLDQALSGCLKASSVPVLGMLYPLGSELFIEAGSGDVGLGTLNPESSLHVATGGDVSLSGGGYLQLGSQSGKNIGIDDNEIMARNGGAPGQLFLNIDGGNVMVGNSSSNGKFGVGTTSPQYDVHVRGDGTTGSIQVTPNVANANAELRLAENTSASLGMLMRYNGTANDLEVRGVNSGGETGVHFFVDRDSGVAGFPTSSARVGIGTASPSGLLHVAGSGGDGSVVLPGDTIGSAEIFGEMGLASDIGSSVITLTSSGDTNLAKRVITTPTSGHVLALGSVQHNNLNLFLEAKLALHIEWTEGAKQTDTVLVDQPSGLLDHTFVQGIFAVGPGTQTISLVGTSFNLDIEAYDPVLTLIFIPTTYGQVDAH